MHKVVNSEGRTGPTQEGRRLTSPKPALCKRWLQLRRSQVRFCGAGLGEAALSRCLLAAELALDRDGLLGRGGGRSVHPFLGRVPP